MKALSLWQPWAYLLASGKKKIETRHWSTSYRGPLAIHAAKKWNDDLQDICHTKTFVNAIKPEGVEFYEFYLRSVLAFGCIIGTVDLTDCIEVTASNIPQSPERDFGNYEIGRYMWICENAQLLEKPVPYKGMQTLFEVPDMLVTGPIVSEQEWKELYNKLHEEFQKTKRRSAMDGPTYDRFEHLRLIINNFNAGNRTPNLYKIMKKAAE
jgi:hypothetical protein